MSRQVQLLLWINPASGHWSCFYVAQSWSLVRGSLDIKCTNRQEATII